MQPKLQHWIWITLAVLALAEISYLAMPPAVIKQATALLSWGWRRRGNSHDYDPRGIDEWPSLHQRNVGKSPNAKWSRPKATRGMAKNSEQRLTLGWFSQKWLNPCRSDRPERSHPIRARPATNSCPRPAFPHRQHAARPHRARASV